MALSAQAETSELASLQHKNITKLVVATSLGNALEWFDISV
jgi:MHS family proline/betaine transporter-like MFS transporter